MKYANDHLLEIQSSEGFRT